MIFFEPVIQVSNATRHLMGILGIFLRGSSHGSQSVEGIKVDGSCGKQSDRIKTFLSLYKSLEEK